MSISSNLNVPTSTDSPMPAITSQILSLFADPRIRGKIMVPLLQSSQVRVYFFNLREPVTINFGQNFPMSPPRLSFSSQALSPLLLQSVFLDSWRQTNSLADVIFDIMQNLKSFFSSQDQFGKNRKQFLDEDRLREHKESEDDVKRGKVMMNGCADNELTQTKNLNRHFRSKLREVYYDLAKACPEIPEDAKWIESSFTMSRVGFDDIAKVLKNEWFKEEVEKQMENGKFMHKIMKGMMSIKSKKLMVKYYHVMLAAAKDPDNFVKWKYQ